MVPAEILEFPLPPTAFTRGYRRALVAGVDPLELLEPGNECAECGHIPCQCAVIAARTVPAIVKAAA